MNDSPDFDLLEDQPSILISSDTKMFSIPLNTKLFSATFETFSIENSNSSSVKNVSFGLVDKLLKTGISAVPASFKSLSLIYFDSREETLKKAKKLTSQLGFDLISETSPEPCHGLLLNLLIGAYLDQAIGWLKIWSSSLFLIQTSLSKVAKKPQTVPMVELVTKVDMQEQQLIMSVKTGIVQMQSLETIPKKDTNILTLPYLKMATVQGPAKESADLSEWSEVWNYDLSPEYSLIHVKFGKTDYILPSCVCLPLNGLVERPKLTKENSAKILKDLFENLKNFKLDDQSIFLLSSQDPNPIDLKAEFITAKKKVKFE